MILKCNGKQLADEASNASRIANGSNCRRLAETLGLADRYF